MIKPKRIIIYGDFWDSYIYSNHLILFGFNGTINSYNWEKIVLSQPIASETLLAYHCAFLQSDYLYRAEKSGIFEDAEFKHVLEQKFKRMTDLEFHTNELEVFRTTRKPVELNRLTVDIGIYRNMLYYCDSKGLYQKKLNRYRENFLAMKEHKLWDCGILGLNFGYGGRLGLAASSDGLYEFNSFEYGRYPDEHFPVVEGNDDDYTIYQISTQHSSYCSWSFSSLFLGTYVGESELFGFRRIIDKPRTSTNPERSHFDYRGQFGEAQIFSDKQPNSILFAGNEKIYRIGRNKLEAVNYDQNNREGTPIFKLIGTQEVWFENIIEAAVVEFGVVIETDKQLYVLLSTGEFITISQKATDKIVRWRVFPRSNCYINQLHVIYNDRIEILSFNDDYFVDQNKKILGQRYIHSDKF